MEKKKTSVEANQAELDDEEEQENESVATTHGGEAVAMLSKVLQLAEDNEMAKALIADALIALENA